MACNYFIDIQWNLLTSLNFPSISLVTLSLLIPFLCVYDSLVFFETLYATFFSFFDEYYWLVAYLIGYRSPWYPSLIMFKSKLITFSIFSSLCLIFVFSLRPSQVVLSFSKFPNKFASLVKSIFKASA